MVMVLFPTIRRCVEVTQNRASFPTKLIRSLTICWLSVKKLITVWAAFISCFVTKLVNITARRCRSSGLLLYCMFSSGSLTYATDGKWHSVSSYGYFQNSNHYCSALYWKLLAEYATCFTSYDNRLAVKPLQGSVAVSCNSGLSGRASCPHWPQDSGSVSSC